MNNQFLTEENEFDVVGIGNAIVDIIVKIDDSFLQDNSLNKGSMTIVSEEKAGELYRSVTPTLQSSGGSAANTLAALAELGSKAGFIGRVSDDSLGRIFTKDISTVGTYFNTPPSISGPSTARCLILVTPDAQRTMCTFLGSSILLNPADIDMSIVEKSKILYLEGYLWDSPSAKSAFLSAASVSKQFNRKVSLSLSDSFCVNRHRASFLDLVENHIDILFANEEEIISLFESPTKEEAIAKLIGKCDLSIITLGKAGSIIVNGKEIINIKPYIFNKALDTTGAGDLYAAGFLHGYSQGKDILECAKIASICAGHIVTQIGPRSDIPLADILANSL
tara:strand:+ start:448 stop:1455 length:1008 start_codon:yes stop_codon:yes gene_type:complete